MRNKKFYPHKSRMIKIIIRKIAKTALWMLTLLVSIGLIWFAANRLLDESQDPQQNTSLTLAGDQIPDGQNVVVGMMGLTAPSGVDFIEYGSKVKALYASNTGTAKIEEMLHGSKALHLSVKSDQVDCWVDPDNSRKGCPPFDQVPAALQQNKELLDRFRALYHLGHYDNESGLFNIQTYLTALKLSIAEMHLELKKRNYEVAYGKWRDQFLFVKGNLRGRDGVVGKFVGIVSVNYTLSFLQNLLLASPEIAKTHGSELLTLLHSDGIGGFNLEVVPHVEYSLLDKFFLRQSNQAVTAKMSRLDWLVYHLGQKNRIMNRELAFNREYVTALSLPWNQVDKEFTRLRDKYSASSGWDLTIDPFGTLFVEQHIDIRLRSPEILQQMLMVDNKLKLNRLLVRILNENVKDESISNFLASVGRHYYDSFSNAPMRWDQHNRNIYFPDPKNGCAAKYTSLLVPNSISMSKDSHAKVPISKAEITHEMTEAKCSASH